MQMLLHMDAECRKVKPKHYEGKVERTYKRFEDLVIHIGLCLADKEFCTFDDTETKNFSCNQKEEKYAKSDGELVQWGI